MFQSILSDEPSNHRYPTPRDTSGAPLKLYTSWFCPFAQRVQLALEFKRIPYEYIDINPYGEDKDRLKKLNPRGLVPTIHHCDHYLYESLVILEYLDDAFPE